MISTKECRNALRLAMFHANVEPMAIYTDKLGPRIRKYRNSGLRHNPRNTARRVSAWLPPLRMEKLIAIAGFMVAYGAKDVVITLGAGTPHNFGCHVRCTARLG